MLVGDALAEPGGTVVVGCHSLARATIFHTGSLALDGGREFEQRGPVVLAVVHLDLFHGGIEERLFIVDRIVAANPAWIEPFIRLLDCYFAVKVAQLARFEGIDPFAFDRDAELDVTAKS